MADSLRDQLLKSGIVKQVQQTRAREQPRAPSSGKPGIEETKASLTRVICVRK